GHDYRHLPPQRRQQPGGAANRDPADKRRPRRDDTRGTRDDTGRRPHQPVVLRPGERPAALHPGPAEQPIAERTQNRPTLGLAMIVRDEAEVIERCIDSVREHIDYWVICDTGSVDGTQDVLRKALHDIPGELHEGEWVDFGHNRTELMKLARGKADYLLLLDADWT